MVIGGQLTEPQRTNAQTLDGKALSVRHVTEGGKGRLHVGTGRVAALVLLHRRDADADVAASAGSEVNNGRLNQIQARQRPYIRTKPMTRPSTPARNRPFCLSFAGNGLAH